MGKLPVKGGVQQGVGDGSNHFLGATFLHWRTHAHGAVGGHAHGAMLGLHHGYDGGEEEEGFAKPRQIGEKHYGGC